MNNNESAEQKRQLKAENARWTVTAIIWLIGAAALWFAWEYQKTIRGGAGEFLAFIITVVAYFYIFAKGGSRLEPPIRLLPVISVGYVAFRNWVRCDSALKQSSEYEAPAS